MKICIKYPILLAVLALFSAVAGGLPAQEQKHPNKGELAAAISSADRMFVGTPVKDEKLFELASPGIGKEFTDQIEIDEHAEWFHDMCYGDGWISFYAGTKRLALVSFHHARSLRWIDGPWGSDALQSGDTGVRLCQWFEKMGFPQFEKIRQAEIAREQAEDTKQRNFEAQLPEDTLKIVAAQGAGFRRESTFARKALSSAPDRARLGAAIFRAFGQVPTDTYGYDYLMSVCREIIQQMDGRDLARALELVESDDLGIRGAAFLFCAMSYTKRLPESSAAQWAPKLATVVLSTFCDPKRPDAMERLVSAPGPQTDELLISIASKQRAFPDSPGYKRGDENGEPGVLASACLVLAMRHHPNAEALARLRLAEATDKRDRSALQIALSLSTHHLEFSPEAFKLESYLIGFGALQYLREQPTDSVPASLIGAAMEAPFGAVRDEGEEFGHKLGVGPSKDLYEDSRFEVQVDPVLAEEAPEEAIIVYGDQLQRARGATKAEVLGARAKAYIALGRMDEALTDLKNAKSMGFNRVESRDVADVLWKVGRPDEAVRMLSNTFPMSDPWDLEVRGIAHLSAEDFAAAENDLSAAALIDPRDLNRLIFQHMAAVLSGRSEYSRLKELKESALDEDDAWSRKIADYLLGKLSEEAFLAASHAAGSVQTQRKEAETYFYLAFSARVHSNRQREQDLLTRCVRMKQVTLTENWLATAWLPKLGTAKN